MTIWAFTMDVKSFGIMDKRAVVILGYESSGSKFVSKVISHSLGKCKNFGDWSGYGFNGTIGDELVILHRSIPFGRPKQWHDEPTELLTLFDGYSVDFVICTRDLGISQIGRAAIFGGTQEQYQNDSKRATELFRKIIRSQNYFIFSFETAVALGQTYFSILFEWLGTHSNFEPEIFDANAPYLIQHQIK